LKEERNSGRPIDKLIFGLVAVIVLGLALFVISDPERSEGIINTLFQSLTHGFDWLFQVLALVMMIFLIWLGLSRYGKIKFGKDDEEPEFSKFSWTAMLFTAGVGASLMYWAMVETIHYFQGPPFGIEGGTMAAAEWATVYGMFHWGISAWAFYLLPGVVVAYSYYVKREPVLQASVICRGAIGEYADGVIGKIIDAVVMLAFIGGTGTTLGVAVPMIARTLSEALNITYGLPLQIGVLVFWIALFTVSAYFGLYKGIKNLANFNLYLVFFFLFVVFIGAPMFILSNTVNTIGLQLSNFIRMSLWTDPVAEGGFPQAWTVFYWAWWAAYSIYMGIFIARISKGRTMREMIFHVGAFGTLGCWVFFATLGSYTIDIQMSGAIDLTQVLAAEGAEAIVPAILGTLPFGTGMMLLFVIVALVFSATTLDSSAYTLASMTYKKIYAHEQPHRWNRFFWSLVLGLLSIGLMMVGGLEPVQLSSVLLGLPVVIVLILFMISMVRWLKEDFDHVLGSYKDSLVTADDKAMDRDN